MVFAPRFRRKLPLKTKVACPLLLLVLGCTEPSTKPIAGLHSAAAPLKLLTRGEPRSLAVGSQLAAGDKVKATGAAVIEYHGGALVFLEEGDSLTVGETDEAALASGNVPERIVAAGKVSDAPKARRIIAARYVPPQFTPEAVAGKELGTGDYLQAFFTPNGMANLGKGSGQALAEGPRKKLPPPPHRVPVPHVHAGSLGEGGVVIEIDDGFAAAETAQLTTALLLEDERYELGTTTRLLLPEDAEVTLTFEDGETLELEGPGDFRLR